jgi:hypothetical protein
MCRRYVPWLGVALCAAIGFVAVRGAGEDRPTQDDQVKKLAQARLDVARQGLAAVEKPTVGGAQGYFRATMVWAERVMQAELETSTTSAQRVAALEAYLQRTRKMEDTARAGLAQKIFTVPEVLETQYQRVSAEVLLAQEKAKSRDRGTAQGGEGKKGQR